MNNIINVTKLFLNDEQFSGDGLTSGSEVTINEDVFAPLVDGLIPSEYLPSYVDDIIEKADYASLPDPGEAGKIYVTLNDNLTYRWSGSGYINITNPHARQHSLQSTSDHTSTATSGALLKADANGLPVDSIVNEFGGKVGFGCDDPGNIIEVKNEGISKSAIAVRRSGGSQQIIRLYENANGNGVIRALDNGANDKIFLSSDGDCYINPINSGKLGIGNSAPSEKLDVTGNVLAKVSSGSSAIISESTATDQGGALLLKGVTTTEGQTLSTISGYNNGTLIGALRIKRGSANNTGKIYLFAVIAGAEKEILSTDNSANAILVNGGGNLGVGCTPLSKFHVRLGTDLNIHFNTVSSETEIKAVNDANNTNIPLRFAASEFNFNGGNIGVGTYAPSEALDVTGNIKSSGFVSSKNTVLHSASNSATISIAYGDATTHNVDIPLLGNGGTLICKFEVYTSPTSKKQTYRCEYKYHMGWGGAGAAKITLPLNALADATSGTIVDVSNGSVYSSTNIRIGFTGTGLTSGETAYIKVTYGFAYESWELNPS